MNSSASWPTASQRSDVAPFYVMDVVAAAARRQASHGDTIALCVGQPATPAPEAARLAARDALDGRALGYTATVGIPELREALAAHYNRTYPIGAAVPAVAAEEVFVSTGSSGGFTALFLAAFDAGDELVMTRPGYPAYRNVMQSVGLTVTEIDCGADTRYQPTVAQLDALLAAGHKPRGLIVTSPSNPTGSIIEPAELEALAAWCEQHNCLLISDEIYHGISFGRRCASAREFSTHAVVIGSTSKYHSMTGWRLGWMLLPEALRRPVEILTANMAISAPALSQIATVAALDPEVTPELDSYVDVYRDNRDTVLAALPSWGVTEVAPTDGAFYVYANIGHITDDSLTWCQQLLDATGVALAPGIDFDTEHGGQMVRISLCGSREDTAEAMERVANYLAP
ncbi:pyridoxal phosphate-dependent aminotransferase [Corynebacterium ulceribovis]|uniref:pyridoxal phosphate-dependent aminotransferase n=1 Tax=Corynebacterium ulceribovis TaxID=487732 RepID=UPI0003638FE0|nr:aminotransferase class I/II-fold pyridoxal phosphate-dependent enzyme [Corynebacterium ulceribovis]